MCMYMFIQCTSMYVLITYCAWQANSHASTGCVYINLLKPTRLEFAEQPTPSITTWSSSAPLRSGSNVYGRLGSNVYEVNPWLWQFGRGKLRLGGLSVEETDDRKEAALKELSLS